MSATDSQNYCAEQVRRFDSDRYLAALFAPDDRRRGLMALYAFNLELAKVRETVSEPMLGRIRLQWWRDALEGIFGGAPPAHAVARELSAAVLAHGLDRDAFETLIDTRELDLEDQPIADFGALESYVAGTAGQLTGLALSCLGMPDNDAGNVARSAGLAWGLTGLLRALPFHARHRRVYLPVDRMREAGITSHAVFERRAGPPLAMLVEEIAEAARSHLAATRDGSPTDTALPALLPLVLAAGYLTRLSRASHDVYARGLELGRLRRQLALASAAWRRRI